METKRWQDWIMLAFGVWLIISPFILSYTSYTGIAAWNSYLFGVAVAAVAIVALFYPKMWEEWVNLALGIGLIVSPFLLQYINEEVMATWNHFTLGFLIAADAIWAVMAMLQNPTHKRRLTS
jgi:hypothetical protein